jgi:hypothetical protein
MAPKRSAGVPGEDDRIDRRTHEIPQMVLEGVQYEGGESDTLDAARSVRNSHDTTKVSRKNSFAPLVSTYEAPNPGAVVSVHRREDGHGELTEEPGEFRRATIREVPP